MKNLEYKLSLGQWDFLFAVPCSVVDKYLNTADFVQIKVLLWALRNKSFSIKEACEELKITPEEFKSAFEFWSRLEVFPSKNKKTENEVKPEGTKQTASPSHISRRKPGGVYIASRIKESPEISMLMKEAEVILGRPISSSDSAVLIMLHDSQGLPVDVILMLLQYAVSIGKGNMRYIETMGINWAISGVDNIEAAENKINNLSKNSLLWRRFEGLIGIEHRSPTPSEEELVVKWYDEWHLGDELIKYAYDICVDTKGKYNIRYMDGILKRWYAKGIFTLEQAKESKNKFKNQRSSSSARSYNIEEFKNYSIFKDE